MSYNYVTGSAYPIFYIRDKVSGALVETITMDLCMLQEGMLESYEEDFKRVILEQNSKIIDYDFRASRITFALDYSLSRKTNSLNIEKLSAYNSMPETYTLRMKPRGDAPREFDVRINTGQWSLGVYTGGIVAVGNKISVVEFITVLPVSKEWRDLDDIAVTFPIISV